MKLALKIVAILIALFTILILIVRNIVKNLDYSFEGFTALVNNFELKYVIVNNSAFTFTFKSVRISVIDNNNKTVLDFHPIENLHIQKGKTEVVVRTLNMDLGSMLTDIAQNRYDNYRLVVRTKILGFIPITVKSKIKSMLL